MSFFSEMARAAGLNEMTLASGYTVINYNGEAVYIEGMTRLLQVDSDIIKAELKGTVVTLNGQSMYIFELSDCVIIKGVINNIEFESKGRRENEKQK